MSNYRSRYSPTGETGWRVPSDLDGYIEQYPEIFPVAIREGYKWYGLGEKAYLALTVGEDCVLGASMAVAAFKTWVF
jgi:hypothetical protein